MIFCAFSGRNGTVDWKSLGTLLTADVLGQVRACSGGKELKTGGKGNEE